MRRGKYVIVVLMLLLTAGGCKYHYKNETVVIKKGNKVIHEKYDENGVLVKEVEYSQDTVGDSLYVDGYYKEYYGNGNPSLIAFFNKGKEEGEEKAYYNNGKVEYIAYHKDGILDSVFERFYRNGALGKRYYYYYDWNGKMLGMQYEYDSLENISNVSYATLKQGTIFSAKFDNKGHILNTTGIPLHVSLAGNPVKIRDSFSIANEVVVIKGVKTNLRIVLKNSAGGVLVDTVIEEFHHFSNIYFYPFVYQFQKPGIYHYSASVRLSDSASGAIIQADTLQTVLKALPSPEGLQNETLRKYLYF